ncbi:MAG TPA: quinol:electron acceptor oxidoreductase subunit ActD [Blastocatellia bacterium]|jgi:hypothetical protein|nr:quinol:electron acceptor oxidoreductase subunit ActD [Blastocatellia bacterium]
MAEKVLAIFNTADEARAAVARLQSEGVPRAAITVMSAEPIHIEGDKSGAESRSRIGLFAVAGAILGGASGYLLTALTSRSINLVTGGMPIFTPWAFGIIIYELTALGAIIFAVGRMIYEARLARPGSLADYDEAVADGSVVLSVACEDETSAARIEAILGNHIRPA